MNLELTNPGDWSPRNALALAMRSAQAYALGPLLATDPAPVIIQDAATFTLCFVLDFGTYIEVIFRGSQNLKNFLTDADCLRCQHFYFAWPLPCEIHRGFLLAYQSLRRQLLQTLRSMNWSESKPVCLGGHSLGGALAILCATHLMEWNPLAIHSIYTYGQPKVGNRQFAKYVETHLGDRLFRHVYENDIVARFPRLPAFTDPYRQAGTEIFLPESGPVELNPSGRLLLWQEARTAWRSLTVRHTGIVADAMADHHINNYVTRLTL